MKLLVPDQPLSLPGPSCGGPGGELRGWTCRDTSSLFDAWRDPEIVRYNPVPPDPSHAAASRWIQGCSHRAASGTSLDLVVTPARLDPLIETKVVGEVGLSGFDEARRTAMIGYWLLPGARGSGLATAAVQTLVNWTVVWLGLRTIVAQCSPANRASQRVASRAGFVHARDDSDGNQVWICHPK